MEIKKPILLYCLIKKIKKHRRLHWVYSIVRTRLEKDDFHTQFPELLKYESTFFNYI
jgi:hypothetical protein